MSVRYRDEQAFPEIYAMKLSNSEAEYIYKRLKKRYKFNQWLDFHGDRDSGNCNQVRVRLSNHPSLGILIHEVSHAIQFKMRRINPALKDQRWHTKKQLGIMRRVGRFCMTNMDKWRTSVKIKHEKSQASFQHRLEKADARKRLRESPEYKLEHLKILEKKALSRCKRADNHIKKIRRRIGIWQRKVKKSPAANPASFNLNAATGNQDNL